jgi:hypothetical protein
MIVDRVRKTSGIIGINRAVNHILENTVGHVKAHLVVVPVEGFEEFFHANMGVPLGELWKKWGFDLMEMIDSIEVYVLPPNRDVWKRAGIVKIIDGGVEK